MLRNRETVFSMISQVTNQLSRAYLISSTIDYFNFLFGDYNSIIIFINLEEDYLNNVKNL